MLALPSLSTFMYTGCDPYKFQSYRSNTCIYSVSIPLSNTINNNLVMKNLWLFVTCVICLLCWLFFFFNLVSCKSLFLTLQRSCTHISGSGVTCKHRPCFPVQVVLESLVIVFSESVQVSRGKAVGDLDELFGQREARNWRIESVNKKNNYFNSLLSDKTSFKFMVCLGFFLNWWKLERRQFYTHL